ncbi:glycosyltransferase family 4 protein [Demequina flava]|uniref:glycosyltransferase family 4 protein n=1 Tax=Demequina flava TaxID=1095025 RepID=UPI0007863663|nr:glycosyltransferase family 1 protein [Demequina flava]
MRVALIAESFLPHTNGVTHSLLRVIDHLSDHGHEAMVLTPQGRGPQGPDNYRVAQIERLPALGWPGYPQVRVCTAGTRKVAKILADYNPDVVHLASPFMLGWSAVKAASGLGLPSVAVYQTEVPSYAARYHARWGEEFGWRRVRDIHERADRTLVPSTHAHAQLENIGVPRIQRWGRGVDTTRFHPMKRDAALHRQWAPNGEVVVGYVGRLAAEKRVEDLTALAHMPGVKVVIVGTGPARGELERELPNATFTGFLDGEDLARAMATFDLFVHCGELETFCQTIQEAHASGVPVVAPRRGGPVDLVDEGVTGLLFRPRDRDAFAAATLRAVRDHEWRDRASAHARVAVQGRTWDTVCAELVGHYEDVIGTKDPLITTGASR